MGVIYRRYKIEPLLRRVYHRNQRREYETSEHYISYTFSRKLMVKKVRLLSAFCA